MGRLKGKVAIITGAAGGQGEAEARLFAKEGAKVVATDLQEHLLADVVHEINAEFNDAAMGLKHDVANEQDWEFVVAEAVRRFGKVDILVNNAGIGPGTPDERTLEGASLANWDKTMDINLKGNFLGMKKVVPVMRKEGKGAIVNISSIAGMSGGFGGPAYNASKGATRVLTKNIALELGKEHIRVNSIHPGLIQTPMTTRLFNDCAALEHYISTVPLGFAGVPEDVAYAALFLVSDEARFITGAELIVDGGQMAY